MEWPLALNRVRVARAPRLFAAAAAWWLCAAAAPSYLPTGSDLYEDFMALSEPRAEVPVGALWVQGFGPYGEGAAAENLVTVRSLSGISLNREQNLRLTLGLLSFLNIDPAYRSQVSARFSDISIVRVKDVSNLSGPTGEPRVYEALRAGTVSVTTDSDVGASLGKSGAPFLLPVTGQGLAGRKRSFALEGRDPFIAYRVVIPTVISEKAVEVAIADDGRARFGEFDLQVDTKPLDRCSCKKSAMSAGAACGAEIELPVVVAKRRDGIASGNTTAAILKGSGATTIALPVPVGDGKGGIFTSLSVVLAPTKGAGNRDTERRAGCSGVSAPRVHLRVSFLGERLQALPSPEARGW